MRRLALAVKFQVITPQQGFNLNGAAEWDRYRTQCREPATKRAAE